MVVISAGGGDASARTKVAPLPPPHVSLSLVVAEEGISRSLKKTSLSCFCSGWGLRPAFYYYFIYLFTWFVTAWPYLLNPAGSGLANLNTSYSKPQIDNTTLRRLLDPKYIYKGLLR